MTTILAQHIASHLTVPATVEPHLNGPMIRVPFRDGSYLGVWEDGVWGWTYLEEEGMMVQPESMGIFPPHLNAHEIADGIMHAWHKINATIPS